MLDFLKNIEKNWVEVYNLGISGGTSDGILKRIKSECEARKDTDMVIIIAIGENDGAYFDGDIGDSMVKYYEFEKNMREIIKISREYTDKIIFKGLYPWIDSKLKPYITLGNGRNLSWSNDNMKKYDDIVKRICDEEKVGYVEVMSIIMSDNFYRDGLHLNEKGHKKIFEIISKYLKENNYVSN